eukprot:scaffold85520_cov51-Attheya_sp.AAC.1
MTCALITEEAEKSKSGAKIVGVSSKIDVSEAETSLKGLLQTSEAKASLKGLLPSDVDVRLGSGNESRGRNTGLQTSEGKHQLFVDPIGGREKGREGSYMTITLVPYQSNKIVQQNEGQQLNYHMPRENYNKEMKKGRLFKVYLM